MPKHTYSKVEDPGDFDGAEEIWCCNDCGAYAGSKDKIKHHKSCKAGESEEWMEFYSRPENQEDLDSEEPDGDGPPNCIEPFTGFIGE